MFGKKGNVTVASVEIATSKICVLIGEIDENGNVKLLGRGLCPSSGSVVKSEIVDMEKAFPLVSKAFDDANQSSGGRLDDCVLINILVSGCGIESHQGTGTVYIKNDDHIVTEKEYREACDNACIFQHGPERQAFNMSEAYFVIDGRRVRNPINHTAQQLDAGMHVIHGESSRLENFKSLLRECGFDDENMEMTFSPLCADLGTVTEDERENGVLLVDFGAGSSEYIVEFNSGILASGVLQVGFNHVINDLAIGLNLPYTVCRRIMEEGIFEQAEKERRLFIEIGSSTQAVRRIPLASFETIIDARIREIFEIIRSRVAARDALSCIGAGCVLTGGGALLPLSQKIFREVFDVMVCRVGLPLRVNGAATGSDDPRFTAVWGGLKMAAGYLMQENTALHQRKTIRGMFDAVDSLFDNTIRGFRNWKGAFKI